MKAISPWQFAVFRVLFGSYLAIHFALLVPYAGELFSRDGVLGDARLNFTFGVLPNPLEHWDSPGCAAGFVIGLAVLAVLFALGVARRTCAVLLWYGWACLFNRNNLICNPGLPYVGLLLLFCALVPAGEPLALSRRPRDPAWRMPAMIFWGAWFLLAAGYTYSGWWKLLSPSWQDGTALHHLLTNPLARPNLIRELLLQLPAQVLQALTWLALAGELLALPLSLTRRGRCVAWLWMMAMHFAILLVVDFADLTFGMAMIHLFTFDPAWLPAHRPAKRALLLFDGDCGLCDRTVKFFLAEDRAGTLTFAPLQGNAAAPILIRHQLAPAPLRSVVLVEDIGTENEKAWTRSNAILRALARLGGFWRVVSWLRIVPRPLRDAAYDFVALHRHRWFGGPPTCSLPDRVTLARLLP